MYSLPEGYEVSSNGGRRVLTSPGPVFAQTASGPGALQYQRRPVARFNSKMPGSAISLLARLDKAARNAQSVSEKREALRRMRQVFGEYEGKP